MEPDDLLQIAVLFDQGGRVDVIAGLEVPLDVAGRGVQRVERAVERTGVQRALGVQRGRRCDVSECGALPLLGSVGIEGEDRVSTEPQNVTPSRPLPARSTPRSQPGAPTQDPSADGVGGTAGVALDRSRRPGRRSGCPPTMKQVGPRPVAASA